MAPTTSSPRAANRAAICALHSRLWHVREANRLIASDPDVMGGLAVFVGTRVPVENIAASPHHGITRERLVESWPFLTDWHFQAALVYSRMHPRLGQQRSLGELNPHWRILSSDVVRLPKK